MTMLRVAAGSYSDRGRKACNQDSCGLHIPLEPLLSSKGIAAAIADGISSSDVSHIASQTAVKAFLSDYYCTSESWTVANAAQRVIRANNSWLHAQTQQSPYRFEQDKGYVCTFSAVVLKNHSAHLFHIGDSRIYRLRDQTLEQLTTDHRLWISEEENYLSRALGIAPDSELDYQAQSLKPGDVFLLVTDGIYEQLEPQHFIQALREHADNLDQAAKALAEQALAAGSQDNLSVQIVRVEALPAAANHSVQQQIEQLPFAPMLEPRALFDGYRILREIHASSRSHVYLAVDEHSAQQVIIKTPSIDLRDNPDYLERFLLEEWIARRINSAHVLKAFAPQRPRNYLYTVSEFIEGKTLAQWALDNPRPAIETVRAIVEQVARGLRAFHRMEMLHQDLKPDNIMIDHSGTVKIIDFGSTRVAGLLESEALPQSSMLGTAMYSAPEYFLGDYPSARSDQFSLGVITYYLLSGRYPYEADVAKARSVLAQRRLHYRSVLSEDREIPAWIDLAIKKAVQPFPDKRYEDIAEFLYDLRHPNRHFLNTSRPPLIERNPVAVWQGISLILSMIIVFLLQALP